MRKKSVSRKPVSEKSVNKKFIKKKSASEKFVKEKFVRKKLMKEKSVTKIQKIIKINNAIYDSKLTITTKDNSLSFKYYCFTQNLKILKVLRISDFEILFCLSRSRNFLNRLAKI